jgi:hypothetical protein
VLLFFFTGNNKIKPIASNNDLIRPMAKSVAFESINSNNKTIETRSVMLEARNTTKLRNSVLSVIDKFDGNVENFNSNNNVYHWVIRIKTDLVSDFIQEVKKSGSVKNESSTNENVKEQLNNNENRMKVLLERKERLQKLFLEGKDKLQIDRELSYIQNEIDQINNTNKQINLNINYTKVNISIYPKNLSTSNWSIENSFDKAINNIILASQKFVDLSFNLILFSPAIAIAVILYKKFGK